MSCPDLFKPRLAIPALMALLIVAPSRPAQAGFSPLKWMARVGHRMENKLLSSPKVVTLLKGLSTPNGRVYDEKSQRLSEEIHMGRHAARHEKRCSGKARHLDEMLEGLTGFPRPKRFWNSPPDPVSGKKLVKEVRWAWKNGLVSDGYVTRLAERIGERLAEHYSTPDKASKHLVEIHSLVDTLARLKKPMFGHGAFDGEGGPERAQSIRNTLAKIVEAAEANGFYAIKQLLPLGRAFDQAIGGLRVDPLAVDTVAKKAATLRLRSDLRAGRSAINDAKDVAARNGSRDSDWVDMAILVHTARSSLSAAQRVHQDAIEANLGELVVPVEGLGLPKSGAGESASNPHTMAQKAIGILFDEYLSLPELIPGT